MSHSDNKAKDAASTGAIAAVDIAKAATINPYVQQVTDQAGQNLTNIQKGDFSGLPLVNAVKAGADRARSYNPAPLGDAALASNSAGGSGYAAAQEGLRKRMLDNTISNLVPQAVQAEQQNNYGVLFPGAQMTSAFQLAKANALAGTSSNANNVYQTSANNGFYNRFGNAFFGTLGQSLGSVSGSAGGGNPASGGFG